MANYTEARLALLRADVEKQIRFHANRHLSMTNLSPAARAVLAGFRAVPTLMDGPSIAGALRALADQVVPVEHEEIDNCWYLKSNPVREQILAIAAELEDGND